MGRNIEQYQCACCREMRDYRNGKLIVFALAPIEQGSAEQICPLCVLSRTDEVKTRIINFFEERRDE